MPASPSNSARRPVLLVTPWYGGNKGGVAVSTAGVAAALTRIGVPVVVLRFDSEARWPTFERGVHGETVVAIGSPDVALRWRSPKSFVGYAMRRLGLAWAFGRLRARFGIRLVNFHYCIEPYDQLFGLAKRAGLPVVTTFRGSEINVFFDQPPIDRAIRRLVAGSDRLTAVSEGLARAVAARASQAGTPEAAARLRVIRNAVPLDFWERVSDAGADEGAPSDALPTADIAFVGNLLPVKGPDQLIEALRRVSERRPGTTLSLVGSGPLEAELRAAVDAAGLSSTVRFVGRVPRSEVAAHLRGARLVAVPSRNEGLPLTAAEAQLLGVPVVAMDVGGVAEIVVDGETGRVVPAGDVEGFADALLELLTDELKRGTFGRNARSRTRAEFDPLRMAHAYAALYDELAAATA